MSYCSCTLLRCQSCWDLRLIAFDSHSQFSFRHALAPGPVALNIRRPSWRATCVCCSRFYVISCRTRPGNFDIERLLIRAWGSGVTRSYNKPRSDSLCSNMGEKACSVWFRLCLAGTYFTSFQFRLSKILSKHAHTSSNDALSLQLGYMCVGP